MGGDAMKAWRGDSQKGNLYLRLTRLLALANERASLSPLSVGSPRRGRRRERHRIRPVWPRERGRAGHHRESVDADGFASTRLTPARVAVFGPAGRY